MLRPVDRSPSWLRRSSASIRVRVTAAALGVASIVAVLGVVIFSQSLHDDLESALLSSARQQVGAITAQLGRGITPRQAAITARDDVVTQIIEANGRIVGTDHPRLGTPIRTRPGTSTGVRLQSLDEAYAVSAARTVRGQLVVVALSEEQVQRAGHTSRVLLGVAAPAALVLLAITVWLAVGRALRPVESMRREAEGITSAHADRRLPEPAAGDELTRLAATLNEMLDRIDVSHRAQRQFVSDASHELRSPLAIIRQLSEVARRHPEVADVTRLTDGILAEERRMEGTVTALLTLARLEEGEPEQRLVDLDDLVLCEVKRAREAGGPEIDASDVGAGQVRGDAVLYRQMVRNLLSNAVRHARRRVTISLHEHADEVLLVVSDDGHGIPVAERGRVFGRFVRLDESRTRDAGGSGLGLAIVEKVVTSAHGSVVADESLAGGACFTVRLPAA